MNKIRQAKLPLMWMAIGWLLAALYILGPRVALNRGLDKLYAVSSSIAALF
nr:hypothetical protein [uncultured Sphingomonas sp.]